MKGNCPHGFDDWAKEHAEEKKQIEEAKKKDIPHWTVAQTRRHFNYIRNGQGNTKK